MDPSYPSHADTPFVSAIYYLRLNAPFNDGYTSLIMWPIIKVYFEASPSWNIFLFLRLIG
jgi:hypothetical protein